MMNIPESFTRKKIDGGGKANQFFIEKPPLKQLEGAQ
jgi:hypothetical protein